MKMLPRRKGTVVNAKVNIQNTGYDACNSFGFSELWMMLDSF